MPVVGILNGQSADSYSHLTATLYLGLKETGFVEGQNVLIEYRWAERRAGERSQRCLSEPDPQARV